MASRWAVVDDNEAEDDEEEEEEVAHFSTPSPPRPALPPLHFADITAADCEPFNRLYLSTMPLPRPKNFAAQLVDWPYAKMARIGDRAVGFVGVRADLPEGMDKLLVDSPAYLDFLAVVPLWRR